jgi:glycosyltransferase involved in cell wall biosynthesis
MNVAILHFHLNRGGVTSVIVNHVRALATAPTDIDQLLVLHGGRDEGWDADALPATWSKRVRTAVVSGLDYDTTAPISAEQLTTAIADVLQRHQFPPDRSLLHAHNHNLGKNRGLPGALVALAGRGYRLLLQIHDFAEDFRPDNYRRMLEAYGDHEPLAANLYPQAAQIHYAVLNDRDTRLLASTGCAADRLHFLPNPVSEPDQNIGRAAARETGRRTLNLIDGRPLAVYPVRGIRRKNVGELLLWSAALRDDATFAITLPPQNPVEHVSYARWRELAAELPLPCLFDIGVRPDLSYSEVLASADRLVTTSVAEGFGMVYLDAWLAGKPLFGRDLPEITADFRRCGLRFPWSCIGSDRLLDELAPIYARAVGAYGRKPPDRQALAQELLSMAPDETIDFAVLPSRLQEQVIRDVAGAALHRDGLLEANPWMNEVMVASNAGLVGDNAATVRRQYALEACGRRLKQVYQTVFRSARDAKSQPPQNPLAILDAFLNISRFRPIRTETT